MRKLEIGPRWIPELAELVARREQLTGAEAARRYLAWMTEKAGAVVDRSSRGKQTLAMLRAGVAKLEDRSAPRRGALAHA